MRKGVVRGGGQGGGLLRRCWRQLALQAHLPRCADSLVGELLVGLWWQRPGAARWALSRVVSAGALRLGGLRLGVVEIHPSAVIG
eukprot:3998997-Alexandrium_andersonii.AAC.1